MAEIDNDLIAAGSAKWGDDFLGVYHREAQDDIVFMRHREGWAVFDAKAGEWPDMAIIPDWVPETRLYDFHHFCTMETMKAFDQGRDLGEQQMKQAYQAAPPTLVLYFQTIF